MSFAVDLILIVPVLLVLVSLGRRLFALSHVSFSSFGEEALFSMGLGFGALTLLTFLLGVLGGLYRGLFYLLFALAALALRQEMWETARLSWKGVTGAGRRLSQSSLAVRGLVLVLLLTSLGNLVGTLAPTTDADTLAYHFAYPKLFIEAHALFYIPVFHANAPLNQHMLYVVGMLLHGNVLAALFAYAQGIAVVVAIILFCRRHLRWEVGVLAAALLQASPLLTSMAGSGKVELGLTLFTFLAFWAFYEWTQTADWPRLVITGIFTGLAVGTKYYGLVTGAAFGFLILVSLWRGRRFSLRKAVAAVSLYGLISVVVGSSWYIRNATDTGNPVYPSFYSIFGGRDWSPEVNDAFTATMGRAESRGGSDFVSFVLAPWRMTVQGDRFGDARTGFGPLFLAFAPVVVLLLFRSDGANRLFLFYSLVFAFIFFTFWFWGGIHRHRHLLPMMPGISIATALAAFSFNDLIGLRRTIWAAIAVSLTFGLGVNLIFNGQFLPVVSGVQSRDDFLRSKLPSYEEVEWVNTHLDGNDRLLHFNRTINYYLDVGYFYATADEQGRLDFYNLAGDGELMNELRSEGITHVLADSRYGLEPGADLVRMPLVLRQFIEAHGTEVYRSDRIVPAFRTLNRGERQLQARIYQIDYSCTGVLPNR